jgi:predicted acetyltransferase
MSSSVPSTMRVGQVEGRSEAAVVAQGTDNGQIVQSDSAALRRSRGWPQASWRVVAATPADQPAIHQFLISVFHQPSSVEFQAQLEEPTYEPADRLLVKSGSRIIAHLRMLHREMHFGKIVLPVGLVADVATQPEYRGQGCATALLEAARQTLIHEGAVLGLLRTDVPRFYARRGWVVCGRHSYATAGPREILSCLHVRQADQSSASRCVLQPPRRKPYNIRLWRQVEQAALTRLYRENTQDVYGALTRTDAYWQWLVRRAGHERVYIAIDGADRLELDESLSPIVGYAAAREGRILEMMCSREHPEASIQLLARVCGDSIERDCLRVRMDAPPDDPLFAIFLAAGGEQCRHEVDKGLVFMAHLLKPRRFLKAISQYLIERMLAAGLPRPCQLGLLINDEKYRLVISRHNVQFIPGTLGRSYLRCSRYDLAQLLLGHVDVPQAIAAGRLSVSTHLAQDMVAALLPRLPLWRPPWDELPAIE